MSGVGRRDTLAGFREALRRVGPTATTATRRFALVELPRLWAHDLGADFWEPIIVAWHRHHGHLEEHLLPWASDPESVDDTLGAGRRLSFQEVEVASAGEMMAAIQHEPIHPATRQRLGRGTRASTQGVHQVAVRPTVLVTTARAAASHMPLGYREPHYDEAASESQFREAFDQPPPDVTDGPPAQRPSTRRSPRRSATGTLIMPVVGSDDED